MILAVTVRIPGEADIHRAFTISEEQSVGDLHAFIFELLDGYDLTGTLKLSIQDTGLELPIQVRLGSVLRDHDWVLAEYQWKRSRTDSASTESQSYSDFDEEEDEVNDAIWDDEFCGSLPSASSSCCAYVCVLWYPGASALKTLLGNAMTLGYKLRNSKHSRLMLATRDIIGEPEFAFLHSYWNVRTIEHVRVAPFMLSNCDPRFQYVFTKLRVMELEQFRKVVLLDADVLPRGDCDEVFDLPPPCAMMRGNGVHRPGQIRPSQTYYNNCFRTSRISNGSKFRCRRKQYCYCKGSMRCKHRVLQGGINAGVVVLKPSQAEFDDMVRALSDSTHRCFVASSGPEQDFLTRYYDSRWRPLPRKYNWQLHQSKYVPKPDDLMSDRFRIEYVDVCILHFSTEDKPGVLLFESTRDVFHGVHSLVRRHSEAPNFKIHLMVLRAQCEWFEAFRDAYLYSGGDVDFKSKWLIYAQRSVYAVDAIRALLCHE